MTDRTQEATGRREKNAFDLLRLVLALSVVYSHCHLLGGFGAEAFLKLVRNQALIGMMAVQGFFAVSGFLVSGSFVARADPLAYIKARMLRILPGLYFALIVTAFVIAPVIAFFNHSGGSWHFPDACGYVFHNLLIRVNQWSVGTILVGLPYDGSLDGALWSLFPEVCCYILVFFLGIAGALQKNRANLLVFVLLFLVMHVTLSSRDMIPNLVPTLLSLTGWTSLIMTFLIGVVLHSFKDEFGIGARQAAFWVLTAVLLLKFGGWGLLGPIVLPFVIINCAYAASVRLPMDLSYGIYILHYPVLQMLSSMGLNKHGLWIYFTTGVIVTALFASVSWLLVEKPALAFKGRRPS